MTTSNIAQFCITLNLFRCVIPCWFILHTKTVSSILSVCGYLLYSSKENDLLSGLCCTLTLTILGHGLNAELQGLQSGDSCRQQTEHIHFYSQAWWKLWWGRTEPKWNKFFISFIYNTYFVLLILATGGKKLIGVLIVQLFILAYNSEIK